MLLLLALRPTLAVPCESHDANDSAEPLCEEWCAHPNHCSYCKCQGCSLCKTPCTPTLAGDVHTERCEEWCSSSEHCTMCKCAACEICKGHHPERACAATSTDDIGYEGCQSWCNAIPQHCSTCKCKGCDKCRPAPAVPCTSNYANDVREAMCEGWCQGAFHCPQAHAGSCKCGACSFCPQCASWCLSKVDCAATACQACSHCEGVEKQRTPNECDSGLPNDTPNKQCSSFCSAAFKADHCQHCACQACGFCG